MQVFQRSRGRFGALQNDISGNAMGSAAAGSPFLWEHTWAAWCPLQLKLRRQGGMARALWLSSFLLSLPSWSRTWPGTFLVRSSSTCPATTQGCQNRGGEPLLEIEGFMGTGIPRNLGWLLPCALWSLPSQGWLFQLEELHMSRHQGDEAECLPLGTLRCYFSKGGA